MESALALISNQPINIIRDLLSGTRFRIIPKIKTEGKLKLPDGIEPLNHAHKAYLRERGLDPNTIEKLWNVQGFGIASRMSWRLFIPVYLNNEVVTWTTRSIGKNGGYISASPKEESIPIKKTLYGLDLARTTVIVVEGPADVWKVGPGSVATFGVSVTPAQKKILSHFPQRIICFDSDEIGRKKGKEIANLLSPLPGTTDCIFLDAEDPGSASKKEIKKLRNIAFGE